MGPNGDCALDGGAVVVRYGPARPVEHKPAEWIGCLGSEASRLWPLRRYVSPTGARSHRQALRGRRQRRFLGVDATRDTLVRRIRQAVRRDVLLPLVRVEEAPGQDSERL